MRSWLRAAGIMIVGMAIGIGLGLTLGWVVWPTEFTNANPSVLQETYRRDYARMIASAYAADGDLAAARQRIAQLGADGAQTLFAVTLDAILKGESETEIRRLVRLSTAVGLYSPAMEPYLDTAQGERDG